jgi:hypothetical protein
MYFFEMFDNLTNLINNGIRIRESDRRSSGFRSLSFCHDHYRNHMAALLLREKSLAIAAQLAFEILRHRVSSVVTHNIVNSVA